MISNTIRGTPETLYRLMVQSITDYAIFMLDPDGDIVSWNAGAEIILRYGENEIKGSSCSTLLPADGPCKAEELLAHAARADRAETECWLLRKDRTRFCASVVIDAVRSDGDLIGYAAVIRDLTERRRAQEDLRRSEESFRLLVQSVDDYAIFMLDRSGRVTNWNLGAERIKGYLPDEIIGEHFSKFYSAEDRANGEPDKNLHIAREEGKVEAEGWRFRRDGTRFWASVVISSVYDEAGELIGFAKVTRDMTEKRAAAEAIAKAQEQLFHSQKLESLGQLTGGVAHDFNNLLQIIVSSINLAYKRIDDAKAMRLLSNALMAADRGSSVTRRMLAFARRQPLNMQRVSLHDSMQAIYGLIASAVGPGILVRREVPRRLPTVKIDPHQLETAILNLCLNSKDAMPNGGEISISAALHDISASNEMHLSGGKYICLSVSDNGEGMSPQVLRRAVEPFFTTKGPGKGTGLGLSMIQGMLEQSGGAFVLRSEIEVGTTAELWMRVAANGDDDAESPSVTVRVEPSRLTILNVDDDVLVRLNTTAMLEDMGHDVIEASSGEEALNHFGLRKVDLVITDQLMPNMTGLQLVGRLRKLNPQLPVVIATGYSELSDFTNVEVELLNKPYAENELRKAINRAFQIKSS